LAAESWQRAEIPGPKKALVMKDPKVAYAMIKRAKHPVLVLGELADEVKVGDGTLLEYAASLHKATGITVVATAAYVKKLSSLGVEAPWMPLTDVGNRLADESFEGFDGRGVHDLALFLGFRYYSAWLILSGLKHFAKHLKTISLDRFYQPHASWSFPNLRHEDWERYLLELSDMLGVGG